MHPLLRMWRAGLTVHLSFGGGYSVFHGRDQQRLESRNCLAKTEIRDSLVD